MTHPSPEQLSWMQAHADDDRRTWLVGANVACLVVAYVSVGLRFMSRLKIGTHLGLDDWLICGAAVCVTGHVSCLLVAAKHGFGRHIIFMDNPKTFVLVTLTAQTFYNLTIPFIKLSILCLYKRIFHRTTGWFTPTLWLSALFVFLFTIPQIFVYIFQCVPIESLWTELGPGSKVVCINFKAAIIVFGVINIVTDWWILALPIPVVQGLHLDKRTRFSICSLFLIGGFVCIISIVRLIYAKNVETVDPTWDYVPISTISTIEASAGILAACMPTWRPLFRFLGRGITSYFSSSSAKSERGNSLHYGNNIDIGRGRAWSRSRSKSRSRKGRSAAEAARGMKWECKGGSGRSETSMSGESAEKILKHKGVVQTPDIELELGVTSEQSRVGGTALPLDAHVRSKSPLDFRTAVEATAGADRWEGLMQQQRLKNERGRARATSPATPPPRSFGDVAFGGRRMASGELEGRRSAEGTRGRSTSGTGWGPGMEGIMVTKTVTREVV